MSKFISCVLGVFFWSLPTLLFIVVFFRQKSLEPKRILKFFYIAEVLKIVLLFVLFVFIIQWSSLHSEIFFLSCCCMQLIFWLTCFWYSVNYKVRFRAQKQKNKVVKNSE